MSVTGVLIERLGDVLNGSDVRKLETLIKAWNVLADEVNAPEVRDMGDFDGDMAERGFRDDLGELARYVSNGDGFDGDDEWYWVDGCEQMITSTSDVYDLPVDPWELADAVAFPDCYDCADEVRDLLAGALEADPLCYVLVCD